MTVGFFDSGIGGVSVLEKAATQLPSTDFLFYADSAHVPYGKKTSAEIIRYVDEAVLFLREQGADVVVLACNTATSAAAKYLREKYSFPILGMEPAVKVAAQTLKNDELKKIIVTATDLTLKLEKLDNLIHRLGVVNSVEEVSLQQLVTFAENGIFEGNEVENYLHRSFSACDISHACAVVLGCTHFTFYKTLISGIVLNLTGRRIPVVDGNFGTVNYLATMIKDNANPIKPLNERLRFFESGQEVPFEKYQSILERAHFENARRD